jgi:cytochrome c553
MKRCKGPPLQPRAFIVAAAAIISACNRSASAPAQPQAPALQFVKASAQGDLVVEGERLTRILGCKGCHESNLQGAVWNDEPEFGTAAPANLTRSAAKYTDSQLDKMIREGTRPDGSALWEMPSEAFTHLSPTDMRALLAYIRSLPVKGPDRPRPTFGPGAQQEIKVGKLLSTPQKVAVERVQEPAWVGAHYERGRDNARMACGESHGAELAGNAEPFRPDLVVASGYSLDEFRRLLKTGEPTGGRKLKLMAEVAKTRFSHLRDEEVESLHRYLVARAEQKP